SDLREYRPLHLGQCAWAPVVAVNSVGASRERRPRNARRYRGEPGRDAIPGVPRLREANEAADSVRLLTEHARTPPESPVLRQDVELVAGLGEEIVPRLVSHLPELVHVHTGHTASELPYASANDHGVDVAHVRCRHYRPERMVGRIDVDVI